MATLDPATALRHEAFGCASCDGQRFKFERPRSDAGYYKFPPTIGATGRAHLLFVGLNPRRSSTNLEMHDRLMSEPAAFDDLAQDHDRGLPYLESESYYDDIVGVAAAAFPKRPFTEVAAVSEYYLCATESARLLSKSSPCAPRFLHRVIPLVAPAIIVPIGKVVADHFRGVAGVAHLPPFDVEVSGHTALVVPMPHRAARPNAYPAGQTYESQLATATERIVGLRRRLGLA